MATLFDPFDALVQFQQALDSYRTSDVRGVMAPLAALAQRHHLAIVGVLHFNKNVGVTPVGVTPSAGFQS